MLFRSTIAIILATTFVSHASFAASPRGLSSNAEQELIDAGVTQYVGMFEPVSNVELTDGWVSHTFDADGGNGPICIAGTPFTAFSKTQNPANVLIFLQGGGACWQNFYFCNIVADALPPPLAGGVSGIWEPEFDTGAEVISNPIRDWSVVYVPYCDGSVFCGDNDVVDATFPLGPVRFHRGLRNVTAAIDLAKSLFPNASRVLLAGSSAGGIGASGNAAFLTRMAFGNNTQVMVFNDAGPNMGNPNEAAAIASRAADWDFGKFYPASCTDCDPLTHGAPGTALIEWRLDNDTTIREAFYSTDGDQVLRFFLGVPTQAAYRDLLLGEQNTLNAFHPNRYKRFIRSGDGSHTALQTPILYLGSANGVPLHLWLANFLAPTPFWRDLVEDFEPIP